MQASEKKGDQVHFPPKGTGARYELPEHTQTSFEVLELIDNYVKTFGPRVGKGTAVRETQLVKTWSLLVLVEHYRKSMASPPSLTVRSKGLFCVFFVLCCFLLLTEFMFVFLFRAWGMRLFSRCSRHASKRPKDKASVRDPFVFVLCCSVCLTTFVVGNRSCRL
mmetsp:Transcript_8148/g.21587  ORF Transcript_8148/g.21587 Transcript_8148/m.21587 type:complete len:164 (-) Transcript_8148:653-1144(-)